MLNRMAFANSISSIVAVAYWACMGLRFVAPKVFAFVFDAQFAGVAVSQLLPEPTLLSLFGTWITLVASIWVLTYLWAWLYNGLAGARAIR